VQVIIDEVVTTLRAVDGEALLAPQTLEKLVRAVLRAVNEQQDHARRVDAELSLDGARRQRERER
jgi:hypothetical protein